MRGTGQKHVDKGIAGKGLWGHLFDAIQAQQFRSRT